MSNIADLTGSIVIKTDQINAEDFIGGITMDITIANVSYNPKLDQPIHIHSEGRQPFKPCLTMRKALIEIWGKDGREWVGRTLTLYRKDQVNFGKQKNIGGVRISHLSHMNSSEHRMMLTVRRGLKEEHVFYRYEEPDFSPVIDQFNNAATQDQRNMLWSNYSQQQQVAINNHLQGAVK